ncbi:hypothetical protein RA224_02065 [Achromobacter aegrifaciens]|uniref:hypothetical protein n=1 Tax=Achromobacter aegrifaciens TaxID=1287736 RepID=UPI0027BB1AC5|nr:hypothetical protein [Achromobacter aegrifaciens]WLW62224.1 hypothetical protein RA224_02065 [Achromobacter aegrifaciens]
MACMQLKVNKIRKETKNSSISVGLLSELNTAAKEISVRIKKILSTDMGQTLPSIVASRLAVFRERILSTPIRLIE